MSFASDARAAIYACIEATWTNISFLWDAENANRWSWRDLLQQFESGSGDMELPFAVVRWMPMTPSAGGPVSGEVYDWPIQIYYITGLATHDSGVAKTQEALMAEIEDKALALTSALRALTSINVMETAFDAADTSEINDFLLRSGAPLWVGAVKATLEVGRTP